jgi:hypothetical protein
MFSQTDCGAFGASRWRDAALPPFGETVAIVSGELLGPAQLHGGPPTSNDT